MVNDGNKEGSLRDDSSFVKPESNSQQQQNYNLYRQRGTTGEGEQSLIMETEGTRLFSDLYRNTSEELFLKSLMESSIGMPVPTMEMLGFKNLSQNFRTDSEELFKSWLTNGENHGCNPTGIGHRTRQASRRISAELANLTSQHPGASMQKKKSNDVLFTQNNVIPEDISEDLNQQSMKNAVERSMHASNLYLAKAWFHSSQPMTRSRSSELRRRYAAMQNSESVLGMEAMKGDPSQGVSNLKQEFANPNDFGDVAMPMQDMSNQLGTFMSPSNSSSSTFNIPQVGNLDTVSSVVNMLKGTLERKKLGNQDDKEAVEDSSNAIYQVQDVRVSSSYDQRQGQIIHEIPGAFQEVPPGQGKDPGLLPAVHQGPIEFDLEGFVNPLNPVQFSMVYQEPSQSESSTGAPVMSSGFEACDGPSNSSICESSRKQAGNARGSENGSKAKDLRERIIDNLKDDRKRGGLVRYGSVTSTGSVDKGDPSKKRRVERSRKMAEAKERNLTPAIPSDMQSVLKRCENLEKEVRSLKLNLSFMNRKDSEQTKQIEELQKQNEELAEEKERLLEEIERIISETGKM